MPKKYKQLKDSWFSSAGDIWEQDKYDPTLYVHQKTQKVVSQREVDDSPNWFVGEPEKKIVERWRGSLHETYYKMGHNKSSIPTIEISKHENAKNHANGDYFHSKKVADRAITRVEIMCRLMGLAETIEEGSTECKGGYMLVSNDGNPYITHSYITYMSSMRLATFSTKELAQLFIDSAGQDAIDWYGAVK